MGIFSSLSRETKQAIGLLSIGTFLEYFDLALYMHMTIFLNELFFPKSDPHTQSLLTAFAFSTTFVFRPIGALVFGYIGDTYGRKITIIITTFMMAFTCLIMANAPTYAQIGITAAWIVTLCRALQGISSMGEIVGAQLFLTEAVPLPARYPAVGLINVFGELGGVTALIIAVLATSYNFDWRMAFWAGASIAVIGSTARLTLRESTEFADARNRIKAIAEKAQEDPSYLEKTPLYNQKVNKKTALSYFLIKAISPMFIYFNFIIGAGILKNSFGYDTHQVLVHNLLISIASLLGWAVLRTYLSTKIYPLRILNFAWIMMLIFVPFLPWLINHMSNPWHLLLIQSFIFIAAANDLPAVPIFFKNFPLNGSLIRVFCML